MLFRSAVALAMIWATKADTGRSVGSCAVARQLLRVSAGRAASNTCLVERANEDLSGGFLNREVMDQTAAKLMAHIKEINTYVRA